MIILFAALLAQIVTPGELKCLGFIHETAVPAEVYISGTEEEGRVSRVGQGGLIYLAGPGLASLKPGATYSVIRPEGTVVSPLNQESIGIYYKELGIIKVETLISSSATATIAMSCDPMLKGDLAIPEANRPVVKFTGKLSSRLTPYPEGVLRSAIVLGKDRMNELAAGSFCFIGAGARDGVKIGDRFMIYRPQPAGEDKLPPRVLGDLVILDIGETTAAARIINSRSEIHVGDIVAKAVSGQSSGH